MPDIGDFIRRSRRPSKIAIAAPGTPDDFRPSRRSANKIAKCVAGFRNENLLKDLFLTTIAYKFSKPRGFATCRNCGKIPLEHGYETPVTSLGKTNKTAWEENLRRELN